MANAEAQPIVSKTEEQVQQPAPTTAELLAKLGDTAHLAGNTQQVGAGGGSH